jgi:hypothetical protein
MATTDEKPVGQMDAKELHAHITARDETFREEQRRLKALLRCLPGGAALLEKPKK